MTSASEACGAKVNGTLGKTRLGPSAYNQVECSVNISSLTFSILAIARPLCHLDYLKLS